MEKVSQAPYRIEERDSLTGAVLAQTDQGWDGPLSADESWGRFARELRLNPGRYDVGSPFRLVLIGPGHVAGPERVVEGPAL